LLTFDIMFTFPNAVFHSDFKSENRFAISRQVGRYRKNFIFHGTSFVEKKFHSFSLFFMQTRKSFSSFVETVTHNVNIPWLELQ
ncbi:MAG: hypothetical protein ACEY3M_05430, partial [Wolbachia sp.]